MNDAWLKKTITLWVQILRIRVVIIQKNRHSRAYQETDILLCHFPPWLEGKLLSSLTLLFHKQTNTDLLFLKHFTPHRPSSDPSSSPSVHSLSFPILFSSFLSRSPSHHLTSSLPTLDTIIYFLSSIWSILKTKVKPKIWLGAQISLCEVTGSGNRGGFAIIQIIASTWCKVNQATMQEQKGFLQFPEGLRAGPPCSLTCLLCWVTACALLPLQLFDKQLSSFAAPLVSFCLIN